MKFIHSLSWWRNENDSRLPRQKDSSPKHKQTGKQSSIRAVKSENWRPRLLASQPHSFWFPFFCGPFRCSIRINSTASEAAQSISKSVDSAGRVSHGVTQSTWSDLGSSTVQMQWCSVSQLKTLLRKASSSQGRQGRQMPSCCYLNKDDMVFARCFMLKRLRCTLALWTSAQSRLAKRGTLTCDTKIC